MSGDAGVLFYELLRIETGELHATGFSPTLVALLW